MLTQGTTLIPTITLTLVLDLTLTLNPTRIPTWTLNLTLTLMVGGAEIRDALYYNHRITTYRMFLMCSKCVASVGIRSLVLSVVS